MARSFCLVAAAWLFWGTTAVLAEAPAGGGDAADSDLYYEVERPFGPGMHWETQVSAGYDFSNPYLNRYSGTIGTYYLVNPFLAAGIEFAGFSTDLRAGARALEQELSAYAFGLNVLAPRATGVAVARVTPLSGIVNFFGTYLVKVDIGLLLRAGALYYPTLSPLGTLLGTGLELSLGLSSRWGFHFALLWDGEKPPGRAGESKVGFRSGPTLRF